MIRLSNYSIKTNILVALVFSTQIIAQHDFEESKIKQLVDEISKYEYGMDRSPLSKFQTRVVNSLNDQNELDQLEEMMIQVIGSTSTSDGKRFACQILSKIGTSKSVLPLVSLLKDKSSSNMARYALEKINDDNLEDQLLDIIDDSNSLIQIGIINTLANRGSKKSVDRLSLIVNSEDDEVSRAAIAALGTIGSSQSEIVLSKLLKSPEDANLGVIADAYLMIADSYLLKNELQRSSKIYKVIFSDERLNAEQLAGLKGLLNSTTSSRQKDSIIFSALSHSRKEIQQVGISNIPLLSTGPKGNILTQNFPDFPDGLKISILRRIKEIETDYYQEFVRNLIEVGPVNISVAAIDCLQGIGDSKDIELLLKQINLAKLKNVSRQSLYGIKGTEFDKRLVELIETNQPNDQVELILAVGERQIPEAFNSVYRTASSDDQKVRLTSYKTLGIISNFDSLDKLMQVFYSIEDPRELKMFENSLAKISLTNEDINQRADVFLRSLEEVPEYEKKMSIIRILGATGDVKAYDKIKLYLMDDNEEIVKVAIQSLYNWPNIDPKNELLEIVKTSHVASHRILAFRGYINLLKDHASGDDSDAVSYYNDILEFAENKSEKSMIISGIATVYNRDALNFAAAFLEDNEIKSEAEIAAIEIIENAGWEFAERSVEVLTEIIKEPTSEDIELRAQEIKQEILNEI